MNRQTTIIIFVLGVGFVIGSMSPIGKAVAQLVQGPAQINGCIYLSSPPTLTNGQQTTFLCDSHGSLLTATGT